MEGVVVCSNSNPDKRKKEFRKRSFDERSKQPASKHYRQSRDRDGRHHLGGSISDPLNLEGLPDDFECPTCVPSPSDDYRRPGDQPSPLPSQLHRDPLNLEEKVPDYSQVVAMCQQHQGINGRKKKVVKKRHRSRQRSKSHSESSEEFSQVQSSSNFNPKAATYCYGNYEKYYGYRNPGVYHDDPRLKLLQKEWFVGKLCLDIGSNSGVLTTTIARNFAPAKITGIEIDKKLVRMAWKNLHRQAVPAVAPDGRPFPKSLVMSCGSLVPHHCDDGSASSSTGYPNNVDYIEGNYVPSNERELQSVQENYNVILCLSLTKWIHLNWGDEGIQLLFRKIYRNLLPGGRLILEPQPWSSYARRKKLTPTILHNYQSITFRPDQFHRYLMSPAVGFTEHQFLGIPDNQSKGFKRPIHLYIKGMAQPSLQKDKSRATEV